MRGKNPTTRSAGATACACCATAGFVDIASTCLRDLAPGSFRRGREVCGVVGSAGGPFEESALRLARAAYEFVEITGGHLSDSERRRIDLAEVVRPCPSVPKRNAEA